MIAPADLVLIGLLSGGVSFILGYVAAECVAHIRAHIRSRRLRTLLDRSTIFKFRM